MPILAIISCVMQSSSCTDWLERLGLFLAALQVYWNLWAIGVTHLYPNLRQEYGERIVRNAESVMCYVRGNP